MRNYGWSLRLLATQAWQRPGRLVLAALATVAAACVVVWVVSGYDSLVDRFGDMGDEYLGRYDLIVLPTPRDAMGGPAHAAARIRPGRFNPSRPCRRRR